MLPQKILKHRCSEIASEAILGQKQSCSSYVVCRVLHPLFGCISYPCMDVTKPADIKQNVVRRTAGGVTNGLGVQLPLLSWQKLTRRTNSQAPETAV